MGLFTERPGDHWDWNRVIDRKSCPRGCWKGYKDQLHKVSQTRDKAFGFYWMRWEAIGCLQRDDIWFKYLQGHLAILLKKKKTDCRETRAEAGRPVRRLVAITQVRDTGGWTMMGAGEPGWSGQVLVSLWNSGMREREVRDDSIFWLGMQSILWETRGWKKHNLELRLPWEMSITSDKQMTPPLWQKVKRN